MNALRSFGLAAAFVAPLVVAAPAPDPVGWVMLGFNVRALISEDATKVGAHEWFYSFSIRSVGSGSTRTYSTGELDEPYHLFEVPPGEYCVSEVRTYANQDLPLCKDRSAPRFEVRAGEVLNLGFWVLGVRYDGPNDHIRYQRLDAFTQQRLLGRLIAAHGDPEMLARLRAAHPSITRAQLGGSVWYVTPVDGSLDLLVLEPDGSVTNQEMKAEGDFTKGRWSNVGDALRIELNGGFAEINAQLVGDRLVGALTSKSGNWEKWIALRDPLETVRYGDGITREVVYRYDGAWSGSVPVDGPPGEVTIGFTVSLPFEGRLGTRPVSLPAELKVLRSEPPGVYDELALSIVKSQRYAPMRGADDEFVAKAVEETIKFPLPKP